MPAISDQDMNAMLAEESRVSTFLFYHLIYELLYFILFFKSDSEVENCQRF